MDQGTVGPEEGKKLRHTVSRRAEITGRDLTRDGLTGESRGIGEGKKKYLSSRFATVRLRGVSGDSGEGGGLPIG